MERNQFTFYNSFRNAARRIKSKTRRCDFYDMLIDYALSGEVPDVDALPETVDMAFELVKPILDAGRRKAIAGQIGGMSERNQEANAKQNESRAEADVKQSGSRTEADAKQTESKNKDKIKNKNKIKIKDKDKDKDKNKTNGENTGSAQEDFAAVLAVYEEKVSRSLSLRARSELLAFVEEMGQDCCLQAIDAALDEGKHAWSYIRAILRAKQEQGVRSLADWERAEQQFQSRKGRAAPVSAGLEETQATEDMQRTRRLVERLRQDEKGEE